MSAQNPLFLSQFWKQLFLVQGTKLSFNTTYHPQTDDQSEVVNHSLGFISVVTLVTIPALGIATPTSLSFGTIPHITVSSEWPFFTLSMVGIHHQYQTMFQVPFNYHTWISHYRKGKTFLVN